MISGPWSLDKANLVADAATTNLVVGVDLTPDVDEVSLVCCYGVPRVLPADPTRRSTDRTENQPLPLRFLVPGPLLPTRLDA